MKDNKNYPMNVMFNNLNTKHQAKASNTRNTRIGVDFDSTFDFGFDV